MDWVAYELRIVIINVFIGIMNKLLHGNIVKITICIFTCVKSIDISKMCDIILIEKGGVEHD